jgi:HEPN domain-containing protein
VKVGNLPQMPPDRAAVVKRWLRWAEDDLTLAEHTFADEEVVARGACVWAHQAAEKAIKALLVSHDIDPPKLHDLDRLAQRLPDGEQAAFREIDLPPLTRWAIDGRYPGDLDEATRDDAEQAVSLAREVLDRVRPRVADLVGSAYPEPETDEPS